MKKVPGFLSILLILLTSCNKNSKPAHITATRENLTGVYKITKIMGRSGTSPETEVTTGWLELCERDDLHKFNPDMSFEWLDAGNKCVPEGGHNGSWSLIDQKTMTIDGNNYKIENFDGSKLVLAHDWSSSLTLKTTYIKQ